MHNHRKLEQVSMSGTTHHFPSPFNPTQSRNTVAKATEASWPPALIPNYCSISFFLRSISFSFLHNLQKIMCKTFFKTLVVEKTDHNGTCDSLSMEISL